MHGHEWKGHNVMEYYILWPSILVLFHRKGAMTLSKICEIKIPVNIT